MYILLDSSHSGPTAGKPVEKNTQDAFGYKYNITSEPSFYEVSESEVVEAGFNSTGDFISISLMAFVEGIIEDLQ